MDGGSSSSLVTLARESFRDAFPDAIPLLHRHYREIAHFQDIPLAPQVEFYQRIDDAGAFRVYTARIPENGIAWRIGERGKLIGYAAFFVRPNPHYCTSVQAVQDVLFVAPEYRRSRTGIALIKFSEDQLSGEGVDVIMHHVKKAHPALGVILSRLFRYECIEEIYIKRLGRKPHGS